jgi:protein-disulfide isomerase
MFSNKSDILPSFLASAAFTLVSLTGYHFIKGRDQETPESRRAMLQESIAELVKEKPELLLGAMNDAAQQQQEKVRIDMEKSAADKKDELIQNAINFGAESPTLVRFVGFIDPMCPHCNELQKMAFHIIRKHKDVSFGLVPVAILGQNSEAMSKFMLSAAVQSTSKLQKFQEKFIENLAEMNRQKLLDFSKGAGLDVSKLEKDELSEEMDKILSRNVALAESLKIQGVPTVYMITNDGKVSLVPPMSLEAMMEMIDDLRKSQGGAAPHSEAPKTEEVKSEELKSEPAAEEKKSEEETKKPEETQPTPGDQEKKEKSPKDKKKR